MKTDNIFSLLCSVYSNSELPAAVIRDGEVFKNSSVKNAFPHMASAEIDDLFIKLTSKSGTVHEMVNNTLYTVNIIPYEDVFVAEVVKSDSMIKLLETPEVRNYLTYVFSKLRHSVNVISVVSDEIYSVLTKNKTDSGIPQRLNTIDSMLMDIISLIIDPEQLVYLLDERTEDSTVSLKDELQKIADDISVVYGGNVKVECDLADKIYARMNRSSFRTIIMDIAAKFQNNGAVPEKIIVSSCLSDSGMISVSLESECSTGGKCCTAYPDGEALCDNEKSGEFFFSYVCDAFCKRYSGSFEQKETSDGTKFTVSFPAVRNMAYTLASGSCFNPAMSHFDTARIRMRKFSKNTKYVEIKE